MADQQPAGGGEADAGEIERTPSGSSRRTRSIARSRSSGQSENAAAAVASQDAVPAVRTSGMISPEEAMKLLNAQQANASQHPPPPSGQISPEDAMKQLESKEETAATESAATEAAAPAATKTQVPADKSWQRTGSLRDLKEAAPEQVSRSVTTLQEVLQKRGGGGLIKVLKDMDKNGDGKISQREFLSAVSKMEEMEVTQAEGVVLFKHLLETSAGGAEKKYLTLEEAVQLFGGDAGAPISPAKHDHEHDHKHLSLIHI
eukprot:55842-Rhodomonas_salina.1